MFSCLVGVGTKKVIMIISGTRPFMGCMFVCIQAALPRRFSGHALPTLLGLLHNTCKPRGAREAVCSLTRGLAQIVTGSDGAFLFVFV